MSLEFQLAWPCPHQTFEEVVTLSSEDRRSLPVRQPVASASQVVISANETPVPQSGLLSAALLTSSVSGPFDVIPEEDTFVVTTSGGTATLTFGYNSLTRLNTDQVVKHTQRAKWSHVEVLNDGGYLTLVDNNKVGPEAFVRVEGSAAASLGFGQPHVSNRPRVAYGQEVYPGWSLYLRPDSITNRFPRFNKPIKSNPVFKVSYSAPVQRCLRCRASFVENDFRYDAGGHMLLIQNEDLLYQAALKILLTDRGSNPFFPTYGTTIRNRIGSKALAGVASVLNEDVRRALAQVQAYQAEQAKYQKVTFKERLHAILGVQVKRHNEDPSTFLIEVLVQNASAEPINLNIVFTVPEVVALMGSNGLMLGTEVTGISSGFGSRRLLDN